MHIENLKKRSEFLSVAASSRCGAGGFLLQGRLRDMCDPQVRVGITASKKVGNAVLRNRAKRRLRAVVRAVVPFSGRCGWDYVLVARPNETVSRPFLALCRDLERALCRLHTVR